DPIDCQRRNGAVRAALGKHPQERSTMSKSLRTIVLTTVALVTLAFAATALAANPHFISSSASGPNAQGNLSVNFKIAGLGANETITVTATADGTALYACQNNGGNFPSHPKKPAGY